MNKDAMQKKHAHRLIYVPHLHRECAPSCLPAVVQFLSPGLTAEASPAEWCSPLLPYSPPEARACLRDLLEYGLSVGSEGDLQALAAASEDAVAASSLRGENRALARFASTGEVDAASTVSVDLHAHRLRNAQKTLLLAWHIEERARDLDALQERFVSGRKGLAAVIGVDDGDEDEEAVALPALDAFSADLPGDGMDVLRPSWRVILDNMAPFLPDDAALFTCDTVMLGALREAGVAFEPATVETLRDFEGLNAALAPKLMQARATLWRALGLTAPQAERPWLDREVLFMGCAACDTGA